MKHIRRINEMMEPKKTIKSYKNKKLKSLEEDDLGDDERDAGKWNVTLRFEIPMRIKNQIIEAAEEAIDDFEPNDKFLSDVFKQMLVDEVGLDSHWEYDFVDNWLEHNGDMIGDLYE